MDHVNSVSNVRGKKDKAIMLRYFRELRFHRVLSLAFTLVKELMHVIVSTCLVFCLFNLCVDHFIFFNFIYLFFCAIWYHLYNLKA